MQIQLTGRLRVRGDNGVELDAAAFPGRQGRVVFAHLTLAGQPVPRDRLAEVLWPHRTPTGWRRNLAAVVSKLRGLLERLGLDPASALPGGGDCYQLCLSPRPEVDVEVAAARLVEAESALHRGDLARAAELARAAAEVARRPLLPEVDCDWVVRQRDVLEDLLLRSLDVVTAAAEPAAALRSAEEALALRPLREAGHLGLMRAHLRAGNRAEALLAHARCRRLLGEELGVEPSAEIQAAHLEALRADDPHSAPLRLRLPPLLAMEDRGAFVGRRVELDRLHGLLDRHGSGPHVAHLTGEPGIGKTRLATEFARIAHGRGAVVLFGRCDSEHLVPYQPFVEALRHMVSALPAQALRGVLGPWAPDLARLLPQIADRLPALAAPLTAAPDIIRYRMFEGVAVALAALARAGPVVLVVDDLQSADRSALALMRHVVRSDNPARLLVVTTCRDADVGPDHPAAAVLAELHRDDLVTPIQVRNLDRQEVGAMLPGRAGWADEVHRRTAGNPFFVRQLVRHLDATGAEDPRNAGVPDGVIEVVRQRLSVLDDDAWRCLTAAAVIGRRFQVEVVAAVAGTAVPGTLDALERAGRARLVLELPDGTGFAFVHDLVREAIYGQLGGHRRALLHRAVAEAIEMLARDSVSELARHYAAAGHAVADRAARYAVRAGEAAVAQLAYENAARQFEAALAALPQAAEDWRGELLLAVGQALTRAGDPLAGQALRNAAAAARAAGDGELLARAALAVAATWAATGEPDAERIALLDEALAVLPRGADRLRARLLAALAGAHYWDADPAPRARHAATAVAIARRAADPATLAICLDADNAARWGPGGGATRRARAREIVALAADAGAPELAVQGHAWGITAALEAGDRATLDAELAAYSRLAEDLRQPRHRWYVLSRLAMRAILSGNLVHGERLAAEGRAIAVRTGEPDAENVYLATMFPAWLDQARDGPAHGRLSAGIDAATNGRVAGTLACARLLWDAKSGMDEAEYRAALRCLGDPVTQPRDLHWMFNVACLAGAAARHGDREQADRLVEILRPHAGTGIVWAGAAAFLGSADHWLGILSAALGRRRRADQHLGAALAFHQRLQATLWVARTRRERAGTRYRPGR